MAIQAYAQPTVIIHELDSGNAYTGVAPNGTLDTIGSGAPYFSGRINFFGGCTAAGLFTVAPNQGSSLLSIQFKGPSTTRVRINIGQTLFPTGLPAPFTYNAFDTAVNSLQDGVAAIDPADFVVRFQQPIFIIPGGTIQVVSTTNLGADGRLQLTFGGGWRLTSYMPVQG